MARAPWRFLLVYHPVGQFLSLFEADLKLRKVSSACLSEAEMNTVVVKKLSANHRGMVLQRVEYSEGQW